MILLRRLLGDVLRRQRQRQGRTLREVSSAARVSLGYLSEVERGQKEASSELLGSICTALDVPMSAVLREVSRQLEVAETLQLAESPQPLPAGTAGARVAAVQLSPAKPPAPEPAVLEPVGAERSGPEPRPVLEEAPLRVTHAAA